jgi:hypothetical protein
MRSQGEGRDDYNTPLLTPLDMLSKTELIIEYVAFALAGCITVTCLALFIYVSLRKGHCLSCGEFLFQICPCLTPPADPDDADLILIPREEKRQPSGILRATSGHSYGTV